MTDLKSKRCVPCEGGIPKLQGPIVQMLLKEIPTWEVRGEKLHRKFIFKGFPEAIAFVNAMAEVSEEENHHPNFCVNYHEVEVSIWTHAIDGLSENDFILAAKFDALLPTSSSPSNPA